MEGWKHQTGDAPVVSGPIIVSQAGLEALAGNVSTLFAELPSQSWLRGPLVARLLHGDMPRDDAEAVSGLSRNYISKAPEEQRKKRAQLKYVDPFDETAARGRFRAKRVSPADDKRAATAEEWLRKNFVVSRSGDKKEMFRTHFSRWKSWKQFQAEGHAAGFVAFQAMWSKVGVTAAKHSLHDYFSCTTCQAHEENAAMFELQANQLKEQHDNTCDENERSTLLLKMLEARASAASIRVR